MEIETDRLCLRRWRESDLEPFARMNADPRVMEFFPSTLTRDQTANLIRILEEKFTRFGFSFCATDLKETGEFIGFIGLGVPSLTAHFTPCVEIGWRLTPEHWGKGYAQEGARASLTWGFKKLGLKEIVSFTTVGNTRSRNVMERIGMSYDSKGDFDHPNLAEGHVLRRHVLYRIRPT